MPKSQIIKDIVEDKVGLERSLNRLYILALDVKNEALATWAEKELNGYNTADELPDYRKTEGLMLKYTGINGSFQVTNQPLQPYYIKPEYRDKLEKIKLCEGIRFLSELASSKKPAERDVSSLASDVFESSEGQIQCISIQQIIPQSIAQHVCAEVKHRMIQALVELENKHGNLDSLGIDISAQKPEQVAADNAELNRTVLNINVPVPEIPKEKLPSKIAWKVIIPIITGAVGAIIGVVFERYIAVL